MLYSLIPDGVTYIINEKTAENRMHLATTPHGIASKHKDRSIPSKTDLGISHKLDITARWD